MLLSAKSLLAALEGALVTGLSAFGASLELTSGTVTMKGLIAAAIAAGIAALYSLSKSLGAIQATGTAPVSTAAPVVVAPAPVAAVDPTPVEPAA